MAVDHFEIKENLSSISTKLKELGNHLDILALEKELSLLEETSTSEDFWNNREKAQDILKKSSEIRDTLDKWKNISTKFEDAEILISMSLEEKDEDSLLDAWNELQTVKRLLEEMEMEEMLSGEMDGNNALLAINAGAGGVDAMDWAEMLQRMYLRWCQLRKMKATIVDLTEGAEAGIASCTILVEGPFAYGYLKGESGVHRLVRISPFDSNARRHTGFASVLVTPDLNEDIDVEVRDEDLRVDVYRASGAGGQHVNKTESAVRLTHLPTGIVAACQNERSQHQNRAMAMRMLKAKLYQLKKIEHEKKMENIVGTKQKIDFGSQIRSYVLAPYRLVTDHRTELKIGNVDSVLDGDLDPFIREYLLSDLE
ncbi:MAG: peptide chain release factor 2 [Deltaproteobacteria bacterium]|nr:peptide chain release factor 2 [Deltaproteobacteria bacterium]